MVLTPAKSPLKIGRAPGSAFIVCGVSRHPAPWRYHWLPNSAKHDLRGPGWAFMNADPKLKHQTRFAYACARWMLRGQVCIGSGGGAIIRRHEGYYHFQDGEWLGPLNWKYTGKDPAQRFIAAALPIKKWVSLFGRLPDLPPDAFSGQ